MKKRLLSAITALVLTLSMSMPVMAADPTTYTTNGTHDVQVTATVGSTFTVAVPADFSLSPDSTVGTSGNGYSSTYEVSVKGNILDTQKVSCSPSATFSMENTAAGDTATASVTQTVNEWVNTASGANQIAISSSAYVPTTGKVEVELPKAGSYAGRMVLTFSLDTI